METSTQLVRFRLIETPCCHTMLCWVNPRLPNFCPECGEGVYVQLKTGCGTWQDCEAWLKISGIDKNQKTPELDQGK